MQQLTHLLRRHTPENGRHQLPGHLRLTKTSPFYLYHTFHVIAGADRHGPKCLHLESPLVLQGWGSSSLTASYSYAYGLIPTMFTFLSSPATIYILHTAYQPRKPPARVPPTCLVLSSACLGVLRLVLAKDSHTSAKRCVTSETVPSCHTAPSHTI